MRIVKIFLCALCLLPVFLSAVTNQKNESDLKKNSLNNTSSISPKPFLDVVEGLLKALRTNDIAKAYEEFTSNSFRHQTSLEDFKQLVLKYKVLNDNKLFQFQSFHVENDTVSFGGDLLSTKGQTTPVEFDFISEGGKWKILGIQIYQNELSLPKSEDI